MHRSLSTGSVIAVQRSKADLSPATQQSSSPATEPGSSNVSPRISIRGAFLLVLLLLPVSLSALTLSQEYEQLLEKAPNVEWCQRLQEVYGDALAKTPSKEMAKTLSVFTTEVAEAADLPATFKKDLKHFHDRVQQRQGRRSWSWRKRVGAAAAVLGAVVVVWLLVRRQKQQKQELQRQQQQHKEAAEENWRRVTGALLARRKRQEQFLKKGIDTKWYAPRLIALQKEEAACREKLQEAYDALKGQGGRYAALKEKAARAKELYVWQLAFSRIDRKAHSELLAARKVCKESIRRLQRCRTIHQQLEKTARQMYW